VIYKFGVYELDTALFELRRDGEDCAVEPQVFDILRILIEHRDRVVTKQELLEAVWPDRFVSESTLSSRLKSARKAVGDSGSSQSVIRTMHGRGFRFVAPVVEQPEAADAGDPLRGAPAARAILAPADERPSTHYARSGMVNIVYQVIGNGPVDIVFVMGWVSHLEMFWVEPSFARFLRRLASFGRLIVFDKRGTGLSDRVPLKELPTLEQRMDDVRAVMDAVGSKRAVLVGVSEGAPLCVLFGATYPERAAGMVLIGGYARRMQAPGYPWGDVPERREAFLEQVLENWGGPMGIEARAPSRADEPEFREWWATYLRMGASPTAVMALMRMNDQIDVRDILPTVRVPTLVVHRTEERTLSIEHGRFIAENIPGAELVELPGIDHLPFVGDQEEILEPILHFISRLDMTQAPRKSLATVLVCRGEGLSDGSGVVDSVARLFGGVLRSVRPDAVVATLDHPARAVRLASALLGSRPEVSAAVHTGECELGDHEVSGPALDVALAMVGETPRGEVRVSRTVHDLVAGSGLEFRDLEQTVPSGATGERELFALVR